MSEYQRYEFMTLDRPLTKAQLAAVKGLSSHIEATATHALIEYHWGDFKHDPIQVLGEYFDAFLYWANWGSPQLAFRFPHGMLPAQLYQAYDLDDFVTLTHAGAYDILDIHFNEMEGPDEWTEYELDSFVALRDELMAGDLRSLYLVWLAARRLYGSYDEEETYEIAAPPVPPGLKDLTAAQQALAELLQLPPELIQAAWRHSASPKPATPKDVAPLVTLLTDERRSDYLVRLARNEPGLSHALVRELRNLAHEQTSEPSSQGEHVPYATLLAESSEIKAQLEREKREQEQQARQRHVQEIHDHQDEFWRAIDQAMTRGSGAGYDEATSILIELRHVAAQYHETPAFQARLRVWIKPHLRRPAFIKRLQSHGFSLYEL